MKLPLLLAALLAVTDSANTGDWIRLDLNSGYSSLDQVRILTQPRAGYNAGTDKVKIFKDDGDCVDDTAFLEGDDIPEKNWECCKLWALEGFKVWPEQQDKKASKDFYVDYKYDGGDTCGTVEEHATFPTVMPKGTYNSYMVQAYETGGLEQYNRVLQFPK